MTTTPVRGAPVREDERSIRVLHPFVGATTDRIESEYGAFPTLSYLVLRPLVVRELSGGGSADVRRDPASSTASDSDDSDEGRELTVAEALERERRGDNGHEPQHPRFEFAVRERDRRRETRERPSELDSDASSPPVSTATKDSGTPSSDPDTPDSWPREEMGFIDRGAPTTVRSLDVHRERAPVAAESASLSATASQSDSTEDGPGSLRRGVERRTAQSGDGSVHRVENRDDERPSHLSRRDDGRTPSGSKLVVRGGPEPAPTRRNGRAPDETVGPESGSANGSEPWTAGDVTGDYPKLTVADEGSPRRDDRVDSADATPMRRPLAEEAASNREGSGEAWESGTRRDLSRSTDSHGSADIASLKSDATSADRLVDRLYDKLAEKMRTERERRGR